MRAHRVVILHVTFEDMAQVLLACYHDMVQTFPADRADQALRISVLPRRARRRRMIANAERANATNEYVAVTGIPIADQTSREFLPATGRRQLVGNPFRRRLRCDAEPEDFSPAVAH